MVYHLLTGATGLLGSYFLRDCLLSGHRMAVLARPSKAESARQRIESLLRHWEQVLGRTLPRCVVLESDLTQADLGLDGQSLQWIRGHCKAVVHNAASLVFRGVDGDGEPFLSNVEGTRRMLDLCRYAGIRQFHYVSTAYVCGLREGLVLESEVDLGQTPGNAYEKSKLQAELMVRAADFLDPPTIYRPSIIVGDSETGFTTTFHGFYTPLKLAHAMAGKVLPGATGGAPLANCLGLQGHERKNFVPVDWVSAVMSYIHGRPEHHGQTYHLTSPEPARVAEMAAAMQEAIEAYSPYATSPTDWTCDGDWFERTFREQMVIYGAYWRDDPQFDRTSTARAAPHLLCPTLDRAAMVRLAKYAIDSNFGRQRQPKLMPEFDVHGHMSDLLRAREALDQPARRRAHLGLQVNGPGGGQWELLVEDGQLVAADDGVSTRATAVYHLNSKTFQQLVRRQLTVRQAVRRGHVHIEGNGLEPERLEALLQAAATERVPNLA
ncbi:MAG: SDR family oxidoreductase [Thermoguttaceae bacterium]|jgi:thioester reductase-like protein